MEHRRLFPVLLLLLLSVSLLPLASSLRFPWQTNRAVEKVPSRDGRPKPPKQLDEQANRDGSPKSPQQLDCSKTSWPEVLGMTGDAARTYIQSSVPQCDWIIEIIPSMHRVPMNYRDDRIRIFLDSGRIVQRVPIVG